ncbi:acyclic terpene utilization AtuA family protein [Enterococcus sp. HY326]|uniref:acyclic terpene utilization AtuA family protein n=1 Tax=Enterococcus sp. HY326 TaxID=2971265 RepID=UPI00223E94EE|nr:acyclic terpene utilization AtuA family protein [Enterococcus sp. HY326]
MKTIRIGSGAGYGGDRIEPALDLIKEGNLDYIIFECLAERTIALAQKEKLADETKGYNPLLEYRFEKILPLLKEHPVKIITNMGAANPIFAARKVKELAEKHGVGGLKIAALIGDDIVEKLSEFKNEPVMETGRPLAELAENILSANAYIGGEKITEALAGGADIIITGRVADPALVIGPMMHEFGHEFNDFDFLGKGTVVGHLLECAGQVTGGYFADPGYKDVADLWNLGFPIAEVSENGDIVITKLSDKGGEVTVDTVTEQLLYEIQDPTNYQTPDVVADFSKVTLTEIATDRVAVAGATGKARTGSLKVSVGYTDGFIGEGEISYGGHNALKRAQLAAEIIEKRFELLGYHYEELRIDYIGVDSLYKDKLGNKFLGSDPSFSEIRLRIAARTHDKALAAKVGQEVEALYTNGPSAGGGARGKVTSIVSVASVLVPEDLPSLELVWEEV